MKAEMRLAIVQDGAVHPYRRIDPEAVEAPPERHLCIECRYHRENNHWSDNIEWNHSCLNAPKYEEHRNFVNGDVAFFDREGWNRILEGRAKGWDWAVKTKENDYFHASQSYEACIKRNADGLCEDYEPTRAVVVAQSQSAARQRWKAARPALAGLVVGGLLGLAGALASLAGS